jgi:hypothetical protein
MAASSAQSMWQAGSAEPTTEADCRYAARARTGIPVLSRATSDELPGSVPAGSIDTSGEATAAGLVDALGARIGSGSPRICTEPGTVCATSGTRTRGDVLEAGVVRISAAGEAGAEMRRPPPINARAGSDEPILRSGNLIV